MRRLALLSPWAIALALLVASAQAGPPVFEPASVTFVSTSQGWALGRDTACHAHPCVELLGTTDGGRSWRARALPPAIAGAGRGHAVLEVRFADPRDGWIYGAVPVVRHQSGSTYSALRAVLWSTHDGGGHWTAQHLRGLGSEDAIYDLEAARGTAWLAASNPHQGVSIRAAAIGGDGWHVVSAPRMGFPAGGSQLSGRFTFADGAGWFVEGNDRGTTGSARLVGGRWVRWTPPCAAVGHSFAIPAASSSSDLVAVCVMGGFASPLSPSAPPGAKLGQSWLYASSDGGAGFHPVRRLASSTSAGFGGPIASSASGALVLGGADPKTGREALISSFDGGRRFTAVAHGEPLFAGFTSPAQGVAIVRAANGTTSLLMTYDGGRRWAPVAS